MYQIKEFQLGSFTAVELLSDLGESAIIIPSLGGMVYQVSLSNQNKPQELLRADDLEALEQNPWFRGRLLFPFNDRIPNAKYSFQNQEYQLSSNCADDGSAIHGLIYNQELNVVKKNATTQSAEMTLQYSIKKDSFEGYPFEIDFCVRYVLSANLFKLEFIIENKGTETAPIALGWHPYFRFENPCDEWTLKLAGETFVEVDHTLMPSGNTPSVLGTPLDFTQEKALLGLDLDVAISVPANGKTYIKNHSSEICLSQDPEFFKYVQCFIPPCRDSIAVEPVSGATDSFNRPNLGRIDLKAGEKRNTYFSLNLV